MIISGECAWEIFCSKKSRTVYRGLSENNETLMLCFFPPRALSLSLSRLISMTILTMAIYYFFLSFSLFSSSSIPWLFCSCQSLSTLDFFSSSLFSHILDWTIMEQHYRVVIIGAGVAGLSCAKYLSDNSIDDFIIIEAQNQIGGRCQTIQLCENCPW